MKSRPGQRSVWHTAVVLGVMAYGVAGCTLCRNGRDATTIPFPHNQLREGETIRNLGRTEEMLEENKYASTGRLKELHVATNHPGHVQQGSYSRRRKSARRPKCAKANSRLGMVVVVWGVWVVWWWCWWRRFAVHLDSLQSWLQLFYRCMLQNCGLCCCSYRPPGLLNILPAVLQCYHCRQPNGYCLGQSDWHTWYTSMCATLQRDHPKSAERV